MGQKKLSIPIATDVDRNIDGVEMIRCSYYSVQSDSPIPNWSISTVDNNASILLLNIEAILLGPTNKGDEFDSVEDIDSMYIFAEQNQGLFVDINDIWVPFHWFGVEKVEQGLVYRISQEKFSLCWKLRHDYISFDEFNTEIAYQEDIKLRFSQKETNAFNDWTKAQIFRSREIYQESRGEYLQKFKE
ncbi:hypothetical protein [Winogradskyella flava]|uniref:hypothetical protein n=1 Tax=Winogradskyella flava TaxID=1884876 RepID=UPI0024910390|nr:hypothetical protein [Winogradskyella flava]